MSKKSLVYFIPHGLNITIRFVCCIIALMIMTIEGLESIKKNLAIPIYEGRVAVYSNEDDSLIRTFTEEECHNAEISENSQVVRIAGELYMVTYDIDSETHTTIEIRLKSPDGYRGDAKTEGIDQYKFYTMADFYIGN